MRTQYSYTIPGKPGKGIIATYEDGVLDALEGIHLIGSFWENFAINAPIPFHEKDIESKAKTYDGFVEVRKLELSATGAKIAAFCSMYKRYLKVKYIKRKGEESKMETVPFTDELLRLYFNNREWWGKQPKSIGNYVSNINALVQLLDSKLNGPKNNYPVEPDLEFEKTVPTAELSALWKFWRENGFYPVKGEGGKIVGWAKSALKLGVFIAFFVFLTGCGLFRAASSVFLQPVTMFDTIHVTVELRDTVRIPAVTLESDGWLVLEPGDSVILEDENIQVEVVNATEATWWDWWNMQPEEIKPALLINKPKLIKVKAIRKPQDIPVTLTKDTSLMVPDSGPVSQGPIVIADPERFGTMEAVLVAVMGLAVALVFYFVRKHQNERNG